MGFNPNKPFTPVKKGFDPSRPFQPATSDTTQESLTDNILGKGKAFAEGAAQGLTLGNVGNIGGAVQSLASYLGKPGQTDRDLESKGFTINQPSSFSVGRAATNSELDDSYNKNPISYGAGFVGGSAPLAAPGRAVFDAAGKGIKGGMALGGVQGALSSIDTDNPTNQIYKAGAGAALGGAIQGAGQLANKGLGVVKKYAGNFARMSPAQANSYLDDVAGTEQMAKQLGNASEDPQGLANLQDQAVDAINNSRKTLKGQGLANAAKLSNVLNDKTIKVNPNELIGLDPRVDEVLSKYGVEVPAVQGEPIMGDDNVMKYVGSKPASVSYPNEVDVPGNEGNALKRYLQEGAKFGRGTVTDPVQAARVKDLGSKSAQLRVALENTSPEVAPLNQSMQEGMLLQQALRNGAKNSPLAYVSSESPDRMAQLARAESLGAGGLFDMGNQLGAAKAIVGKNVGSGVDSSMLKAAGRAGLRGVSLFEPSVKEVSDFPWLQQLTQESAQGALDNSTPATSARRPLFNK